MSKRAAEAVHHWRVSSRSTADNSAPIIRYGDKAATKVTVPKETITEGLQRIDGVTYDFKRFVDAESDLQLAALLPEQKVLMAFDLVFSDVIMPGMSGVEMAQIIRERYPDLPVVLTSGYSSVLAQNIDHGFELIQKPYSVEALSRTLRKAILERTSLT